MLSFSSLDQTNTTGSLSEMEGLEQGEWYTIALWIVWAMLYHVVLSSVVDQDCLYFCKGKYCTLPLSFRVSSKSLQDNVCPRRKARWYKCTKRSEKQCEKKTPTEECCLARCAMNLVKLHLPPPLPLKPKKKNYNKRERSITKQEDKSSSSSSCCSVPTSLESDQENQRSAKNTKESSSSTSLTSTSTPPLPLLQPPSPVPLIDLARMQYWQSILEQTTRRGAKYRDCDGLYPLHWACSGGPPVEVVQALLHAYPSAARKTDKEGSTALHFATHYSASVGVVQALLDKYPQAASVQDRYGRTPLLHAVEKCAGMDVLEQLVAIDPAVITLPCLPATEGRQVSMTRGIAQRTPLYMAWSAVLLDRKVRTSRRGRKWEKAMLLLQSAYQHCCNRPQPSTKDSASFATTSKFNFVSAAIALDLYLPAEVLEMAVSMHPQELQVPDEMTGRLPLSQAAAAPLISRQRSDDIIKLLLQHGNPMNVYARDALGKSALHLALEAGKPWSAGVGRLFQANPDAIHWSDKAGIVPALAAATVATCIADHEATPAEVDENPLGFLSPKYKEIMRRRRAQLLKPLAGEHKITSTEQVSTILDVLRADPSVILATRS